MDIEQEATPIETEVTEVAAESDRKKKKISKPRKKSAKKSETETADEEYTEPKAKRASKKKTPAKKESDMMIEETPEEPQILDPSVKSPILAMAIMCTDPSLKSFSEEEVAALVQEYKNKDETQGKEKLVLKLLIHQIDGNSLQISNLAESCKEYLDKLDTCFEGITKEYLIEKVLAWANNANYSVKHDVAFEEGEKPAEFKIWEVKEENDLVDLADLSEVSRVKKLRQCTKGLIEKLIKFMKSIEKMKTADDSQKVIEEKQKYEKALELKDKITNEANQPKTAKKTKKNAAAAATQKNGLTQSIKKMKIDSNKPTPSVTPAKDSVEEKKSNENEMVDENEKKVKEIASAKESPRKEAKSKPETPVKPKNNTLLTQFFMQKKPEQKKPETNKSTEISMEKKSKFKCLGSKINKIEWSNERSERFVEDFLRDKTSLPAIEKLREDLISKYVRSHRGSKQTMITTKKTRNIFVHLQDSFRKIKGKFESASGYVSGRTPLAKDPQIDYDMDSEEEFEAQHAENLDEIEDAEEEDEDDQIDEEESVFIVSDGHLSSYEQENINEPESRIEEDFPKEIRIRPDPTVGVAKPFYFSMINSYKPGADSGLDEYLQNFMIIKLTPEEEFPLKSKHTKNVTANGKAMPNPNAIDEKENLLMLIRALHGCYASKEEVIKDVNTKNPACSKNSLERKIKEICSRDKIEGENKKRLLVKKELFIELGIEQEYEQLLASKRVEFEEKEAEAKKMKTEEPIDEKENLLVFIRALHGCYTSKEEIIKEVNTKVPACSQRSIERKIKEISSRDKIEGENRKRLLVRKELFTELDIESEYEQLLASRRAEFEEKETEAKKLRTEEKEKQKQLLMSQSQTPANSTQMSIEEAVAKQPSPKKPSSKKPSPKQKGDEMETETPTPSKKQSSKEKKTSEKKKNKLPSTTANSADGSNEKGSKKSKAKSSKKSEENTEPSPTESPKEEKKSNTKRKRGEKASPKRSKIEEERATPAKTEIIESAHPNGEAMEEEKSLDIDPQIPL